MKPLKIKNNFFKLKKYIVKGTKLIAATINAYLIPKYGFLHPTLNKRVYQSSQIMTRQTPNGHRFLFLLKMQNLLGIQNAVNEVAAKILDFDLFS